MGLSDLPVYLMRGALSLNLSSLSTAAAAAAAVEDLEVMRFGDLQNERFRDEATFGTVQAVLQNSYGLE